MSITNNLCECEPGRFHPKKTHDEEGCLVTIYNKGRCACERQY